MNHASSSSYAQQDNGITLPLFNKDPHIGRIKTVNEEKLQTKEPFLYYEQPHGKIFVGDAIKWLRTIDSETVDLVFADPPYNIKKAEWDSFESQQHYIDWSMQWIEEAARILKPTGTLYICGFSE